MAYAVWSVVTKTLVIVNNSLAYRQYANQTEIIVSKHVFCYAMQCSVKPVLCLCCESAVSVLCYAMSDRIALFSIKK